MFLKTLSDEKFGRNNNDSLPAITSRLLQSEMIEESSLEGEDGKVSFKVPDSSSQRYKFEDLLNTLCSSIDGDKNILYFLIFVAGIEGEDDLTDKIKHATGNFKGYEGQPENVNYDPYHLITTDDKVLDRAFEHALNTKSLPLIKYILNGADKCFINATINDQQVLEIIESLNNRE